MQLWQLGLQSDIAIGQNALVGEHDSQHKMQMPCQPVLPKALMHASLPVTRVVYNVVDFNCKLFSEEKICRQYVML